MIVIEVTAGEFWNKNSLMRDTSELASNLFKASLDSELPITNYVVWYYGKIKDVYGNVTDDVILSFAANKDTIQKINWDGFDKENMCEFLRSMPTENFDNVCVEKVSIE